MLIRLPRLRPSIATVVAALATVTAGVVAACRDTTSPPIPRAAPVTLLLAGPGSLRVTNASTDAGGRRTLACSATLQATASGGEAQLDSVTITYAPMAGGPGRVQALTALDASLVWGWGGTSVPVGTTRVVNVELRHPTVFTATVALTYHGADGAARHASTEVRCEPPVLGTYTLRTINDVRLPAPVTPYATVTADTLTFTPDLTYTTRARSSASGDATSTTPPLPYEVVGPDSLRLPQLLERWPGGLVVRSGTTLTTATQACCGWGAYTWRFDSAGTTPALPPAPAVVLSKDTLRLVVVQGGPVPAPDTVFVTSNTSRQVSGLEVSAGGGECPQYVCAGEWLVASPPRALTPTFVVVTVRKTALPVGTYTSYLTVASPSVGASPASARIMLTVTPP